MSTSSVNSTSSTAASGSRILTSLGIGSGLDVSSIINSLVAADSQPLTSLQTAATGFQAEISEYGQISSAYSQLQAAIKDLQNPTTQNSLFGLSAASTASTVATATITGPATTGSYSLDVSTLAAGEQIVTTGGNASDTAAITTSAANISIQLGAISGGTKSGSPGTYSGASFAANGAPVVVSIPANATLADIRDAINSSGAGVSATLINDGANYRLALSSTGAGADTSINITSFGDSALAALVNQDPKGAQNFQETQAATNLSATLNGLPITGASNTLDKTVSGLSIAVASTGKSTVAVTQNATQASSALASFVSAWNGLSALVKSLTSYDATTKTGGPLMGDPLAGQAYYSLVNNTFGSAATAGSAGSSTYTTLASIGLTIDSTGTASVNSAKLATALKAAPNSVANLFSISKGNILSGANSAVTTMLGSNGISARTASLSAQISANQKQQDAWSNRLTQIRANLTAQYTAMDTAVAGFQSTASFLTNQIAQYNKTG